MTAMINTHIHIYSEMSLIYANTMWIITEGIRNVILQKNKHNCIIKILWGFEK